MSSQTGFDTPRPVVSGRAVASVSLARVFGPLPAIRGVGGHVGLLRERSLRIVVSPDSAVAARPDSAPRPSVDNVAYIMTVT
jgi:hypothetical protein